MFIVFLGLFKKCFGLENTLKSAYEFPIEVKSIY